MVAALLGLFQQRDQRSLGVGNDAQIRLDHVADLGRLDIDVDELPLARVNLHLARMAVGKAAAYADDEVGFEEGTVAHGAADLDAGMSGAQRMIIGQAALAHVGHNHGDLQVFGQRPELGSGIRQDDAAAQDQ